MARLSTTSDVFNAIAEPQRRRILSALAEGERPVNDLAELLALTQPQISKHLRVLRAVKLVAARDDGQRRIYHLEASGLKGVHDWVAGFERFWSESFDKLEAFLNELHPEPETDHERPQPRRR